MIVVVGASLAGLAAAARLARAGHEVVLCDSAPVPAAGAGVATEPGGTVLTLPAAWRDLFRKTGRSLDAELARTGLVLAPAPARPFVLSDGSRLALPTDRGEQWSVLAPRFGQATAAAWRDLLDELDGAWQVLRRLGLETEFEGRLTSAQRAVLRPRTSLAGLAERVPPLADVVLDVAARLGQDPARLPGWHAARLAVERTFGRWHVQDARGVPQPAGVLAGLLVERLQARGVNLRSGVEALSIRPEPGVGHRVATTAGDLAAEAVVSAVDPFTHADLTRE
ncbi:FAD-dependent oxidoreductase, partial [Propionicimonas sp.]|uniref:FAD-dependent oxidoreductase n=1 Tax=Propionicimonas sp. TaxID=1955623 RepID=UPI0039E61D7A